MHAEPLPSSSFRWEILVYEPPNFPERYPTGSSPGLEGGLCYPRSGLRLEGDTISLRRVERILGKEYWAPGRTALVVANNGPRAWYAASPSKRKWLRTARTDTQGGIPR